MVIAFNPNVNQPIAGRGASSPIGTSNPNTGSVGNTNSSYAPSAYTSGVSALANTVTAYTVNDTDYQGFIIFNTASAVAVSLNSSVRGNFSASVVNLSSGAITLTPTSPDVTNPTLINGATSLAMASKQGATVFFSDGAWWAFVGATLIPVVPSTIAPVTGEYLTGYNATTGLFSASSPAGLSVTITTAKLTGGGANGSMTFSRTEY